MKYGRAHTILTATYEKCGGPKRLNLLQATSGASTPSDTTSEPPKVSTVLYSRRGRHFGRRHIYHSRQL